MNLSKIKEILMKNDSKISNNVTQTYLKEIQSMNPKTEDDVMNAHKHKFEVEGWDY